MNEENVINTHIHTPYTHTIYTYIHTYIHTHTHTTLDSYSALKKGNPTIFDSMEHIVLTEIS